MIRRQGSSCTAVDTVTRGPRPPWSVSLTPFVGMQQSNPCSSKPDLFGRALQHANAPATQI
ncbi:hypothetical protein PDIG_15810 [Penicillium digitatum PHI26]|uniref:Uncharacterized protein n=2 Tax=Penicillium digitatum TaxID=36651 RepID=K9G8H8_PEND2|nr:hypothetical protein PDIP_31380 [Penicillium digitatum Pd1]EKV17287.1 hypothetical protein PDIG_15810 [Penicillium digitatum PHI26]EKV17518.1 hypothetical protein PDIP_31380 [Penicillium digitatum Pd1]